MLAVLVAASTLNGCAFDVSGIAASVDADPNAPDAGPTPDGGEPADAGPPPVDAPCWAWDPLHFDPCPLPDIGDSLTISTYLVYDTDLPGFETPGAPADPPSMIIEQPDGTQFVLISVNDLDILDSGSLRVLGSRPLAIAANGSITVAGLLDVSSKRGQRNGAGANYAMCPNPTSGENDDGGAGGGGGGFQGTGGDGGRGDSNDNNGDGTAFGGSGGASVGVPGEIRGGCRAADGGSAGGARGQGGASGGAVLLASQEAITVTGTIEAGGEGGRSGPIARNGGGGGGSGGYIGFDAPSVTFNSAIVAANGGGGGEGGLVDANTDDGDNGEADSTPASGGSFYSQAGDGAAGGAGNSLDGFDANDFREGGGGGGGGAVGYIIVRSDAFDPAGSTVSPTATPIAP